MLVKAKDVQSPIPVGDISRLIEHLAHIELASITMATKGWEICTFFRSGAQTPNFECLFDIRLSHADEVNALENALPFGHTLFKADKNVLFIILHLGGRRIGVSGVLQPFGKTFGMVELKLISNHI